MLKLVHMLGPSTVNPDNFVAAVLRYWLDNTSAIAEFERTNRRKCFRLQYEALVVQPEDTLRMLCRFLDLPWQPSILTAAFEAAASRGPGDRKVWYTKGIVSDSVGRGTQVPLGMVPPPLLEEINKLLPQLDYPVIEADWNVAAHPIRSIAMTLQACKRCEATEGQLIEPIRLRLDAGSIALPPPQRVHLVSEDLPRECCGQWVIDGASGRVQRGATTEPHTRVVTSTTVCRELLAGANVALVVGRGGMRIKPAEGVTDLSSGEIRFLCALLFPPADEGVRRCHEER